MLSSSATMSLTGRAPPIRARKSPGRARERVHVARDVEAGLVGAVRMSESLVAEQLLRLSRRGWRERRDR